MEQEVALHLDWETAQAITPWLTTCQQALTISWRFVCEHLTRPEPVTEAIYSEGDQFPKVMQYEIMQALTDVIPTQSSMI